MRTCLLACLAALVLGAVPVSAPAAAPAGTAAKKCKPGFKKVTVKRNGKKRTVCKRKQAAAPAGPTVGEVEAMVRDVHQARHESWQTPEDVVVTFEQPTRILPMRKYDPYEADPLNAGGPVPAWPVLMWVKVVNNGDTTYDGCLGHLNSFFPFDNLVMVFRGASGEWTFLTSTDDDGECG